MCKTLKTALMVLVIVFYGSLAFASQTMLDARPASFSFVSYLNAGGGTAFIQDELPLQAEFSYGLQLSPWFSLGGFVCANPLSNFEHADLGVSIANTEAAFALMSGTEFIFTAYPDKRIHPFLRLALGGITVGYLEDVDADEGYDRAQASRSPFASLTVGLELDLTKYTMLALRGGWRFAGHAETMGIEKHGLSGLEVCLSVKTVWRNTISSL